MYEGRKFGSYSPVGSGDIMVIQSKGKGCSSKHEAKRLGPMICSPVKRFVLLKTELNQ